MVKNLYKKKNQSHFVTFSPWRCYNLTGKREWKLIEPAPNKWALVWRGTLNPVQRGVSDADGNPVQDGVAGAGRSGTRSETREDDRWCYRVNFLLLQEVSLSKS